MNMMNDSDGTGDGTGFPFWPLGINIDNDNSDGGKIPHDGYNVYVNREYVGDQISLTQADEDWRAIQDYLKSREFEGFKVRQKGNQIYVDVEDDEEVEDIKNHLGV